MTLSTDFDPRDPSFARNPYATYRALRDRPTAAWNAISRSWMITRYDDVRAVLVDHDAFASRPGTDRRGLRDLEILGSPPPAHTRLRKAIAPSFTPSRIAALRTRIEQTVDSLLDSGIRERRLELMRAVADPLPLLTTMHMLGLEGVELERVKTWADDEMVAILPDTPPSVQERVDRTSADIRNVFERRWRDAGDEPGNDTVLSQLHVAAGNGQITQEEAIAFLILLLRGGSHTITHLIGNGVLALLRNRDQLEALSERPELWQTAVDELTRHSGPMHSVMRWVQREVTVHGVTLQPGEAVDVVLASANRDERHYADPDALRLDRPAGNQLGFGRGIHYCVGAELGKLQVRIAIERLLERMPVLSRVDLWLDPEWDQVWAIRGLRHLFLRSSG